VIERANENNKARMGSTRLPGKSMKKIMDKTLLELMMERVKKAKHIAEIAVATSKNPKDDVIELLTKM
jgi:spore coat polysaccharide biosynthesis protein SpsF